MITVRPGKLGGGVRGEYPLHKCRAFAGFPCLRVDDEFKLDGTVCCSTHNCDAVLTLDKRALAPPEFHK